MPSAPDVAPTEIVFIANERDVLPTVLLICAIAIGGVNLILPPRELCNLDQLVRSLMRLDSVDQGPRKAGLKQFCGRVDGLWRR